MSPATGWPRHQSRHGPGTPLVEQQCRWSLPSLKYFRGYTNIFSPSEYFHHCYKTLKIKLDTNIFTNLTLNIFTLSTPSWRGSLADILAWRATGPRLWRSCNHKSVLHFSTNHRTVLHLWTNQNHVSPADVETRGGHVPGPAARGHVQHSRRGVSHLGRG